MTFGLMDSLRDAEGIILAEPMNYIRFMNFVFNCKFVITDSGGIQEETTYLGIPCLTMRPNTERPVTVDQGTNQLCTMENLKRRIERIVAGDIKPHAVPDMWDGHTAGRIVESIRTIRLGQRIHLIDREQPRASITRHIRQAGGGPFRTSLKPGFPQNRK